MSTTSCRSCLLILPPSSAGSTSTVPMVSPCTLSTFRLKCLAGCVDSSVATGKPLLVGRSFLCERPATVQQKTQATPPRVTWVDWMLPSASRARKDANLDVYSWRKAQALAQGFNEFARRLQDIDQALVGADFELFARLAVDVRAAQNGIPLDPRRQRGRSWHERAGPLGG